MDHYLFTLINGGGPLCKYPIPRLKAKCDDALSNFCFQLQLAPLRRGAAALHRHAQGGAVQVDPMKPALKAPDSNRLKLEHEKTLSNFAFNFNLRRYTKPDVNATAGFYTYPTADIAKMYDGVPCANDPTAMCYNQQKWRGGHWEQALKRR